MNIKHLAISAVLAATVIAPAQAGHFVFHYAADPNADFADPGSTQSATIFLTTSDTLNTVGGYDILSATGTIDGNAITALVANPNQPDQYDDGLYIFDNVLDGSGMHLSELGIAVKTALAEYNFGYFGDPDHPSYSYALSADGSTHINPRTGLPVLTVLTSEGPSSLAAVPEPASWAMMVAGFGLAGATMRRRRSAVRFA